MTINELYHFCLTMIISYVLVCTLLVIATYWLQRQMDKAAKEKGWMISNYNVGYHNMEIEFTDHLTNTVTRKIINKNKFIDECVVNRLPNIHNNNYRRK